MSFRDLYYGWTQIPLTLTNVTLHRGVRLDQRGRDGAWTPRDPMFWPDDEERLADFEAATDLRYVDVLRTLTADARAPERCDARFVLGVPEDKQAESRLTENLVEVIKISIHEAEEMNFGECRQRSNMKYYEPRWERGYPGGVTAWFAVPSEAFDRIAAIFERSGDAFEVTINAKLWYWIGPIGDSQYYIDTTETQPVELAEFRAYKTMMGDATVGDDNPEGNVNRPLTQAEFSSELLSQLHTLQRGVRSIITPLWLLAGGLVGLSVYLKW